MSKTNKRELPVKTHQQMIAKWMTDPAFKEAYDDLAEEYELLHEMLRARQKAGLTQAEVAKRMGTHPPAVARLEAANPEKPSPSLSTLRKYAHAVGCKLEVHLKPCKKQPPKRS